MTKSTPITKTITPITAPKTRDVGQMNNSERQLFVDGSRDQTNTDNNNNNSDNNTENKEKCSR